VQPAFRKLTRRASKRGKKGSELFTAENSSDPFFNQGSEHCRDEHGILTVIPPTLGRPTIKPAKRRYRRLMQTRFNKKRYGQRWQVETTISMIKRLQGSATKGRSYHARRRDMMLMVLTHNIMIVSPTAVIVIQIRVFYRADLSPLFSRSIDDDLESIHTGL
jgi:hypothetical protein